MSGNTTDYSGFVEWETHAGEGNTTQYIDEQAQLFLDNAANFNEYTMYYNSLHLVQ